MSPRRLACLALAFALLAPVAFAEEEADDGELVVCLFDVGALSVGTVDYIPEVMGTISPDMVTDEENPLFGAETEEPFLPVGTIDELMVLIRNDVQPVYWQISEGAELTCIGERILVVQASKAVVAEVAQYLAELEADVLKTVTLEVRAVRAPEGGAAGDLDRLLEAEGLSVTLTALVGQQAAARVGMQYSYVQDYDVEVAQDARVSDPIVGVANWGLSVTARAASAPEAARLRVSLDAILAVPTGMREHTTDETRLIELPLYEHARLDADLILEPGAWTVAQGNALGAPAGRWVFLVRATPTRVPTQAAGAAALLDPSGPADAGPLVSRRFDVSDLEEVLPGRRGWELNLVPSNFTPPEPPELAEPMPLLAGEELPDLVRSFVAPGSWNRDGTAIDVRYGMLFVTNTERVLARVESLLGHLRRRHLWSVELETRLYDVPAAFGRRLVEAGGGATALLAPALADGTAREVDDVHLSSLFGARNAVFSGRLFTYVQDFEVEIAEKAVIANPVIQRGPDGIVVDLEPLPTSSGRAVHLAYQVTRTHLGDEIRQVSSPHGPIDVPALEILRLRGNLLAPLGEPAVVGAGSVGDRMQVLFVRPVLKPYGG